MQANGKPTAQLANLSDEPESPHGDHDVNDRDDGSSSSGDEVDRERIARYEKSKLRYYFAIVECSDAVAADALYRECDGKTPATPAQMGAEKLKNQKLPESSSIKISKMLRKGRLPGSLLTIIGASSAVCSHTTVLQSY